MLEILKMNTYPIAAERYSGPGGKIPFVNVG